MEELVFAFPTKELWNLLTYREQGFIHSNSQALKIIVRKGLFRKREQLEADPSFKQIIPYGVISCKDSFYLFKRCSGQTEKRLQNLYSLGVGGHMNPGKSTEPEEQFIIGELKRELSEEVRLSDGCRIESIEFIGFINDDTIQVGRFHIGLLYNIRLSGKEVIVNETDKMTAEWIDRPGLSEFYEGMETWTKIAFDHYIRGGGEREKG
ncbi:MAG: NUDIX hydrolase [Bacteroidia bacterium]|nr:NUDIX hydrolase [Bacteroidia bacterium]